MPREDVNLMGSAFCLSTERRSPTNFRGFPGTGTVLGCKQVVRWYVSRIGQPSSAAREPVGDPRYLISTSAAPRASAIAQWHPIYLLGGDFGIILPDGPNLHLHSTHPSSQFLAPRFSRGISIQAARVACHSPFSPCDVLLSCSLVFVVFCCAEGALTDLY